MISKTIIIVVNKGYKHTCYGWGCFFKRYKHACYAWGCFLERVCYMIEVVEWWLRVYWWFEKYQFLKAFVLMLMVWVKWRLFAKKLENFCLMILSRRLSFMIWQYLCSRCCVKIITMLNILKLYLTFCINQQEYSKPI